MGREGLQAAVPMDDRRVDAFQVPLLAALQGRDIKRRQLEDHLMHASLALHDDADQRSTEGHADEGYYSEKPSVAVPETATNGWVNNSN